MNILKSKDYPLWHLLAVYSVDQKKDEKRRLLKEALSYKPTQSWPYILLIELTEDIKEKIDLANKAIMLGNNFLAYMIIYQIMKDLKCHKALLEEKKRIDFSKIKENNFLNIFKDLDENNNKNVYLFNEFLSISNIHKDFDLIRLKDSSNPEDIKRIIDYQIIDGKIKVDQEKILKFHPHESILITNEYTEMLAIVDYVVLNNKLILGYEHGFMSNESPTVNAAGRFFLDQEGCLMIADNWSGHYRPTSEEMKNLERFLIDKNVDLFCTKFDFSFR